MEDRYSRTALLLGEAGVEKLKRSRVAVFGLGGVGSWCAEALARAGVPFATGVLHEHDADGLLARSLASRAIFERDFEPVSPGAVARAREVLLACREVICCVDAFGTGNARNAELLDAARAAGIPVRHAGSSRD